MLFASVEKLLNAMEHQGWATEPCWLGDAESIRLRQECAELYQSGNFRQAGVGRGNTMEVREEIRGDQVLWFQPGEESPEQNLYLAKLEELRLELNRRLFLGLFEFEGHFAIYPEGAFYKAHLDRHAGTSERIVTIILYLNPHWRPGDGGELKLWTRAGEKSGDFELIEPRMGTLVVFMAGEFWHEVLPACKTRMSITGWFRQS